MDMGPEFDDFIRGIGEELEKLGGKPKMVKYLLTPVCRDDPGRIPNRLAHLDHIASDQGLYFLLS